MAYHQPSGHALRQGDILANVRVFKMRSLEAADAPAGVLQTYGYSIVVTQDCDLDQDHCARFPAEGTSQSPDKQLFGVLMCGVYPENTLMAGKHRERAKTFSRNKEWKPVTQNQDPRYQYLGFVPAARQVLVADFKDYFLVPCDFLYEEMDQGRVARLSEMKSPYKEHVLQRFAWYLMRVGLPVDFAMLPAEQASAGAQGPVESPPLAQAGAQAPEEGAIDK